MDTNTIIEHLKALTWEDIPPDDILPIAVAFHHRDEGRLTYVETTLVGEKVLIKTMIRMSFNGEQHGEQTEFRVTFWEQVSDSWQGFPTVVACTDVALFHKGLHLLD